MKVTVILSMMWYKYYKSFVMKNVINHYGKKVKVCGICLQKLYPICCNTLKPKIQSQWLYFNQFGSLSKSNWIITKILQMSCNKGQFNSLI